ncbi:ribonuclease H-like domain-containing protein, partial [Schizophyllum fasciatum]
IGGVTLDNASNNGTMMEHLEKLLTHRGIYFDRDGNRIRFYIQVLIRDPVGSARAISTFVRWSDQRRLDLEFAIKKGNELLRQRAARQANPNIEAEGEVQEDTLPFDVPLRVVVLLRDVDTRWSATYLMIRRLLYLYPAVVYMFQADKYRADRAKLLDNIQLRVLTEISIYMRLFHQVQELFSASNTPTLSHVIPAYELLLKGLKKLKKKLPGLAHVIQASEAKLVEYLGKSRRSRLYALAMGINPRLKFEWAKENWPADEVEAMKAHFKEAVC